MKNSLRAQIHNRLTLKDTEELLEIWHNHDTNEWVDEVFEVAEEILVERLGELPALSSEFQDAPEPVEREEAHMAERITERPYKVDESQAASQTDEKQRQSVMEQLDQALWYAYDDEPKKALAACEAVKPILPDIAEAWNYLGIIYDTLGDVDLAMEAYIKAVQLDPDFPAGRQNLRNARVRLEGEQYHRAANLTPEETQALSIDFDHFNEAEIIESDEPIPGWYYLDETAYLLPGWPGYRTRPGRSGYDQLDSSYELSHIEGILIRRLFTRTLRTRSPMQLLYMIFLGLIFCIPLLMVVEFFRGDFYMFFPMISTLPILFVGVMLLVNVFLSLVPDTSTEPHDGNTFF